MRAGEDEGARPVAADRQQVGDDPLGIRLLDTERTDLGTPERPTVPTERVGDCADVCTRADAEIEPYAVACIRDDVERSDLRAPRRHLHLDAAPCQPVGALPADLHRGGCGNRQLHLTAEGFEPLLELLGGWRVVTLEHVAFGIAGRRPAGQIDVGQVALVESDKASSQPSCRARQQE